MIQNAIASVPVRDMNRATEWYERLFGRPADSVPMAEVAEWGFEGGGWLQVYEAPDRAGGGSVTLSVRDLNGELERLRTAGFEVESPRGSESVRVSMLPDPDGNTIALAEASDPTMAQ